MPDPWGLEEEEPKKKKKEEEPITDFDALKSEYERQSHRAQNDIDQRFVQIGSVIEGLLGNPEKEDWGLIGDIRNEIRTHSLEETSYGRNVVAALKMIERVSRWSPTYAKQMEGYIRAFQFYCKSAFEIIKIKIERVKELEEAQIKKIPRTRDEVIMVVYNKLKNDGIEKPSLRVIANIVSRQGFEVSHATVKTVLDSVKPPQKDVKPTQEDLTQKPTAEGETNVKPVTNQEKKEEKPPSGEK